MYNACAHILPVLNTITNCHLPYPCMGAALKGGEGGELDVQVEGGGGGVGKSVEQNEPKGVLYLRSL